MLYNARTRLQGTGSRGRFYVKNLSRELYRGDEAGTEASGCARKLVHGQVTIIFVVSVCLSVCLFVQSFSQPSSIRFGSN